jgi:hypothetical protein
MDESLILAKERMVFTSIELGLKLRATAARVQALRLDINEMSHEDDNEIELAHGEESLADEPLSLEMRDSIRRVRVELLKKILAAERPQSWATLPPTN